MSTPDSKATNADLADFLDCGDDTRRVIMRVLGMPKRRSRPWSEVWAALGLAPEQPGEVWDELTLGRDRKNRLWDPARVAAEIGCATDTVNDYCRTGKFPVGFPSPVLDLGPRRRWWLPLDVRAYNQPAIYKARAALIRRLPATSQHSDARSAPMPKPGTLTPLPSQSSSRASP